MSPTFKLVAVNVVALVALLALVTGCGPSMTDEEAQAAVTKYCAGCHTADSFGPLAGSDWAATTALMESDYGLVLTDAQRTEAVTALNQLYGAE